MESKYDVVMYSYANDWISEEFLKEKKVKGYYPNEEYYEDDYGPSDKYIYDKKSPSFRTFIIQEEEEFNRSFSKCEEVIDFEKNGITLYLF